MANLVYLDTETTSLDDLRGEVWEIGLIEPGGGEWLWQLAPQRMHTADPNSLRISRFYKRFDVRANRHGALLVRAPGVTGDPVEMSAGEVAADLARILDGMHVAGAVPDFDYRFLRAFLREHGQVWTAHYHLIDVVALAVGWLAGRSEGAADVAAWLRDIHAEKGCELPEFEAPGPPDGVPSLPWRSADLYRAVGVEPEKFEAHTALGDARLVRAVYDAITEEA